MQAMTCDLLSVDNDVCRSVCLCVSVYLSLSICLLLFLREAARDHVKSFSDSVAYLRNTKSFSAAGPSSLNSLPLDLKNSPLTV